MTLDRLLPVVALLGGTAVFGLAGPAGMAATGGTSGPALAPSAVVAETTAFPDGPPARVTGGFGEDSCFGCHWDGTENDGVGSLAISGFPDRYEPGAEYDLTVKLGHPDLETAGFQLAVRDADGEIQAGTLQPGNTERVAILVDRGIQFAHQTAAGSRPAGDSATTWILRWTAPEEGVGPALLHVSAVAGDGDASQMGDAVYSVELRSHPKPHIHGRPRVGGSSGACVAGVRRAGIANPRRHAGIPGSAAKTGIPART